MDISNINAEDVLSSLGKSWTTDRHHRIYINDLPTLYGLSVTRYGTGNISSATLNGDRISNSQANKLLTSLDLGKLWYDFADGQFHALGLTNSMREDLLANLEEIIAQQDGEGSDDR